MLSAANGSFVIIFISLLFNCSFAISVFKILSITYLVKSLVYPTPPLVSIDDSSFEKACKIVEFKSIERLNE